MIEEGARLATQALTHHPPTSWSVQAAIAALHDEAPSFQETDWHQVRLLYDELSGLTPTPVVALNRAVAISWHEGPQAGLDHLEALGGQPGLARQHYWHAARGRTLARLGRHTAAAEAYRRGQRTRPDTCRDRLPHVTRRDIHHSRLNRWEWCARRRPSGSAGRSRARQRRTRRSRCHRVARRLRSQAPRPRSRRRARPPPLHKKRQAAERLVAGEAWPPSPPP